MSLKTMTVTDDRVGTHNATFLGAEPDSFEWEGKTIYKLNLKFKVAHEKTGREFPYTGQVSLPSSEGGNGGLLLRWQKSLGVSKDGREAYVVDTEEEAQWLANLFNEHIGSSVKVDIGPPDAEYPKLYPSRKQD